MDMTANLEAMIVRGMDGAALRLALASRYFALADLERALEHAEVAVAIDADYSAAWKLLGRIRAAKGLEQEAADAFVTGIGVAERRGDEQAAKEMQVFLKRLNRDSK
jgi:Tfp pilus assembly protein PilF